MRYEPKPYADQVIYKLATNKRSLLYADVGMGKTSMSLMAALIRHKTTPVFPLLVISFNRLVHITWPSEIVKWDDTKHLRYVEIAGNEAKRLQCLDTEADVYGIAFSQMPWLIKQAGVERLFKGIIVDECTRLASNRSYYRVLADGKRRFTFSGGKQTAAIAWLHCMIQSQGGWFVALSGSGVGDNLQKAWGVAWFCDFGESLGRTWSTFMQRMFKAERMTFVPLNGATQAIAHAMVPYTITLNAADHLPLSEPRTIPVYVELSDALLRRYKKLERDARLEFTTLVGDTVGTQKALILQAAANTLANKLSQFASGFVLPGVDEDTNTAQPPVHIHNEKIEVLKDLIEEIDRPVIVVYYYRESKRRLQEAFNLRFCDASDPHVTEDWNAGKVPILALHWQAAHGLNLQYGGHDIIFYECRWSYENYYQAYNRIGPARQLMAGFNRIVNIYTMCTIGTIETRLTQKLAEKQATHEQLIAYLMEQ